MKLLNTAVSVMCVVFSTVTLADMKVVDTANGAWVTVSEQGAPVANAEVTVKNVPQSKGTYMTNENGRVFVPLSLNSSRSVKYNAVTENGTEYNRYAFHSDSKR